MKRILALLFPKWQRRANIKKWYRIWGIHEHLANYSALFAPVNGFKLSQEARVGQDAFEYTYGEIEFVPYIALLSMTQPTSDTVFYDLGSGVGKAVIACAMVFPVRKACGIEWFSLLHDAALKRQRCLQAMQGYLQKARVIHFINADFLTVDFSDATLIFINATGFFGETWEAINQTLIQQTQMGTIVITTSKALTNPIFTVTATTVVEMSWGYVTAYIHKRLS